MDETELDKSETATPFKLKRAREKGTIARGTDLGFFTALLAFIGYIWLVGEQAARTIAHASDVAFGSAAGQANEPQALLSRLAFLFSAADGPLLLLAGIVFCVVLLFEFFQVGPVFSFHPLKPDFSKINPAKGLKRLFSWRLLIEAMKSLAKLLTYSLMAWLAIRAAIESQSMAITNGAQLMTALAKSGFKLLLYFGLTAMFFALVDQMLVRRDFTKKMRMSRRELKREHRDREGDGRLKQKRKEFHNEFLKMAKSIRNARGSDVILVNPTHYAVALRYNPGKMSAPMIVSRGSGGLAERIRQIGFVYGVLIIQDAALARALFRTRILEGEIPDNFYDQVADLYRKRQLVGKGKS
jgi:flagellar biosynthesis protein FlhB